MDKKSTNEGLSELEKDFCQLYVNGCDPYAGNLRKCYEEIFNDKSHTSLGKAKELLASPSIQDYIKELSDISYDETMAMKKRLTEKLLKIVDETSEAQFYDRRGTKLSVAPLRSVAVQGCKALMDLYPVKETQESKLKIEGAEGGVVFNVIVPESQKPAE